MAIIQKLGILLLAISLTACAKLGPKTSGESGHVGFYQAFIKGDIVLDCHLLCSMQYGKNRAELQQLYEQHSWLNLATRIIEIGSGSDQSYYYLAKAAEGLNRSQAAQNYYLASINEKQQCNSLFNNCDGLDLPTAARAGLAALQNPSIAAEIDTSIDEGNTSLLKITRLDLQKTNTKPHSNLTAGDFGRYFALVIGNNDYLYLDKLKTAENDAKALSSILQAHYGFNVKLLLNANRADILDALNAYKNQLNPKDNLIIYYAGHGVKDGSAYWLPVDAKKDSSTQWIQAETLTTDLKKINSDHILVISDSCYSGELSRGTATLKHVIGERENYLKKLFGYKSRTLIASGGNEPVADHGKNNHSVFANALLDALKNTPDDFYTDGELFEGYIKEKVAGSAAQIPQYSYLKDSGHNDGSFIFVKHK